MPFHSLSATPKQEETKYPQEEVFLLSLSSKKKEDLLTWQSLNQRKNCEPSADEKPHFELQVSSDELFVTIALWALPFLYKNHFSPVFSGLEKALPLDHMCQVTIVCCCRINLFCDRNIWLSLCFRPALFGVFSHEDPEKTPDDSEAGEHMGAVLTETTELSASSLTLEFEGKSSFWILISTLHFKDLQALCGIYFKSLSFSG